MPDKPVTQTRSFFPVRDQLMPQYAYPTAQKNDTLTVRNRGTNGAAAGQSVLVNGHLAY